MLCSDQQEAAPARVATAQATTAPATTAPATTAPEDGILVLMGFALLSSLLPFLGFFGGLVMMFSDRWRGVACKVGSIFGVIVWANVVAAGR